MITSTSLPQTRSAKPQRQEEIDYSPRTSMADSLRSKSCIQGKRRQTSRLQQRAPASLQIGAPSSNWNLAIPLLSPLDSSPTSSKLVTDRTVDMNSREESRQQGAEPENVVLKKWQHPPFGYDPAPRVRPFVPV